MSTLFNTPGMLLKYFSVDEMHGLGLGPLLDAIGGLLHVEISNKKWHRSRKEGLEAVNSELADFYKANPEFGAFTPLRMGQLHNTTTKYPTLKAKAAVAKHMVGFCIVLAHRHAGHGSRRAYALKPAHRLHAYTAEYGRLVVAMFEGVQNYYRAQHSVVHRLGNR